MKRLLMIVAFGLLSALPSQAQAPAPAATVQSAPGAGSTTITTSAPVSAETTISLGTYAGQALMWLAAAFSVPVGTILTGWLFRLFKLAGVQATDQMRQKLQEIVVNGLNAAAANNADRFQDLGKVEIRNVVIRDAIRYAQDHGAETIKALGLDPSSGAAVEAIKARIETAITDPTVPTPTVVAAVGPDLLPEPQLPIRRETPKGS
jgi:hypothetical protein